MQNIQGILDIEDPPFVVSEVSVNCSVDLFNLVQVTIEETDVVTMEEMDTDTDPTPMVYKYTFVVP